MALEHEKDIIGENLPPLMYKWEAIVDIPKCVTALMLSVWRKGWGQSSSGSVHSCAARENERRGGGNEKSGTGVTQDEGKLRRL